MDAAGRNRRMGNAARLVAESQQQLKTAFGLSDEQLPDIHIRPLSSPANDVLAVEGLAATVAALTEIVVSFLAEPEPDEG